MAIVTSLFAANAMSSSQSTLDFLLDQLGGLSGLSTRRMFGEYCIYLHGKPVGFICDDQLYLKITVGGRLAAGACPEGLPYPGAKPYLLITADRWEDRDWLTELIQTTYTALPLPKHKPSKAKTQV